MRRWLCGSVLVGIFTAVLLVAMTFAAVRGLKADAAGRPDADGAAAPALESLGLPVLHELPEFASVRARFRPSQIRVLDRNGVPVGEVRRDFSERRGRWVSLQEVSPAFVRALLLSEDRRFFEHDGVDWRAVASAGWALLTSGELRGASTISMQLAALLDPSLRRPAGGRDIARKMQQARQAWRLESAWSKEEILEAYVNLVAFRGELRGLDAVSRVMFRKHPHGLDDREAAVAAALLRGPNASASRVAARACALLVAAASEVSCEGMAERVAAWLAAAARPAVDTPRLAVHHARRVLEQAQLAGMDADALYSALDAGLQRKVVESVRRHLAGMEQSRLTDAAVVVLANDSGEVLAYVGSSGGLSAAAEVDHARALRQAGSTLKPFLYALAFERRYLTAASLLDDAPLDVGTASGLYIPQNYDRRHSGLVSVRTALASSLNIPAVRTLMLVGPERFAARLRALGLPLPHDADHYGYSLALGSADIDLLSLTNAYRTLANRGTWTGGPEFLPVGGRHRGNATQLFDQRAAWIVGDILADRGARARTFGLESPLATRHWTAVKTGTSKDMRDNWCIGWSDRYTVGVWVGNSQGHSMRDVSGVSAAAPIWHEVMSILHEIGVGGAPALPHGLEKRFVTFADDLEAARHEYFIEGTALVHVTPVGRGSAVRPRIESPVNGTVIAMDPDMPPDVQRLALRAVHRGGEASLLRWQIDGREHATGGSALWLPHPGRHRIVLMDAAGAVLDQVSITVRDVPAATGKK